MLALLFKRQSEVKKLLLRRSADKHNVGHLRLAFSYRTGFVKRNDLYSSRFLECRRSLKEYSLFRSYAVSDHYRNRRCKSECARTAYYEDRNASCECVAYRLARYKPRRRCNYSYGYYHGNEYSRDLVCDLSDRRFSCRRIAHHFYYLRDRRILSDARRLAFQESGLVYRRRRHRASHNFINGYALARQR